VELHEPECRATGNCPFVLTGSNMAQPRVCVSFCVCNMDFSQFHSALYLTVEIKAPACLVKFLQNYGKSIYNQDSAFCKKEIELKINNLFMLLRRKYAAFCWYLLRFRRTKIKQKLQVGRFEPSCLRAGLVSSFISSCIRTGQLSSLLSSSGFMYSQMLVSSR
jgi:hypothetical protein